MLSVSVAAALLAGCAPTQSQGAASTTPPLGTRVLPRPDRRPSYMLPVTGSKSALIYAGELRGEVNAYQYTTGKQVGTLTGLIEPYGMCVDAKGDVFIANFGGGNAVEYAHGGSKVLNTYTTGGEPIGCSVDANGDVAVTSVGPGEVVIFARGDPSKSTTYTSACTRQWGMGYDDKGNLVGIGKTSTNAIVACALLSGSKSIIVLSGCCKGPIVIWSPGGTMWDGKYLAVTDQEARQTFVTGIVHATLSGTTLVAHGSETILNDNCLYGYADLDNPFIVGEKNTPINRRQGKVVIGSNLWCVDGGSGETEFWHYPAGGSPFKTFANFWAEPNGAAVSLKGE